jgi:hypothetical protein
MTADFRALCAELTDRLQHAITSVNADSYYGENRDAVDRARAALAQPEPEGPTDEAWEWYSYCPEDGIELHLNKELAQKAAQEVMGNYAKAAYSDGWHEDMESVSWGMLLPVEQAQVVERTEAEPDSEFDEWIRYELVPSRYARPTIEPVPVSERLPGPEDCDAEGRCWWWIVDQLGELPHWIYCQLEVLSWTNFTAWLPHHALPVPTSEEAP